jgi:hypothetical protein
VPELPGDLLRPRDLGQVPADRRRELGGHRHLPVRHGELPPQGTERPSVASQGAPPLELQGVAGDLRGDAGVTVAVTPDPGPVPEKGAGRRALPVLGLHGIGQVAVNVGHHLPDRAQEEVKPLLHFVAHAGALPAHRVGGQEKGHLAGHAMKDPVALARRGLPAGERLEEPRNAPLPLEHRRRPGLGRVRRERGPQVEGAHAFEHLVQGHASFPQRAHGIAERLGAHSLAAPFAVDAHDLLLLGLVHEVEEGREGAEHLLELVGVERGQQFRGAGPAGFGVTLPLGTLLAQKAERLDPFEHRGAVPLRQRLSQERAQQVHLLAQGTGDPGALACHVQSLPPSHACLPGRFESLCIHTRYFFPAAASATATAFSIHVSRSSTSSSTSAGTSR